MGRGLGRLARLAAIAVTILTALWLSLITGLDRRPALPDDSTPTRSSGMLSASSGHSVPEGQTPTAPALIIPVTGVRLDELVDTYTQARASGARRHDAIDILAPRGTAVIAAAPGTIEKLLLSKDGGNTVYVRSIDRRRIYYYAHLDSFAPGLDEGMTLRQGNLIGAVGSTGNADPSAPHLHFAVWMTTPERKWWEEAVALNPFPLLRNSQPGRLSSGFSK